MSTDFIQEINTISSEMCALALKLKNMIPNDELDMLAAIEQQIGKNTLCCKHCGKTEQPLSKFMIGLNKLFKNGKLTKIPKTCDVQTLENDESNIYNNPVNNAKASIKRWETKLAAATTDAEKELANTNLKNFLSKLTEAEKLRDEWHASREN